MIDKPPIRVEISYKTVIFTVAFFIAIWFLFQIRDIILMIFLAIIILSALLKPVEWLVKHKIPRIVSILLIYLVVICLISVVIGIIVPPLINQSSEFVNRLGQSIGVINDFLIFNKISTQDITKVFSNQTQQFINNIFNISRAIVSSIFLVITLFVFTFYLLLEWKKVVKLISSPFSGIQEKKVNSIISKVETGLGHWLRGQLSLSVIVGVLTFIGLSVLKVPFALPLALIAAILEIIPIIGPIVSSIPAIIVALSVSPVLALATAAMFFLVQQLENHLIVPLVMSKVVGLQPPVVIIALLIGAKLAGVGGAFLAVPTVVLIKIIISEFITEDEKMENELMEY